MDFDERIQAEEGVCRTTNTLLNLANQFVLLIDLDKCQEHKLQLLCQYECR